MTSSEAGQLLHELREQHDLLERVATGTSISEENDTYRERRDLLVPLLTSLGQDDPFPWRDLWAYWNDEAKPLATHAARRSSLNARVASLESFCLTAGSRITPPDVDEWSPDDELPATWTKTLARLDSMKSEFKRSVDLDDYQDVGRRCREIIIAATDLVHDRGMVPEGQEAPKQGDAKERMNQICAALLRGPTHEKLRAVLQKTLQLAHHVTHSGSVTRLEALAAAQSTIMLVSTLRELERLAAGPPNDPGDADGPVDPDDLTDLAADYWNPRSAEDEPNEGEDSPDVQLYDQTGA
ncbi:hypothetical protein [Janibacter sp. Soil728]|uniref:hypothetical protein n=1 Tax=Janibacter sp. Soil728 TaxID=1736393 RepID=UPI0012E873EC|nr:hypothetical protein [Janibacter sp. Soil728]